MIFRRRGGKPPNPPLIDATSEDNAEPASVAATNASTPVAAQKRRNNPPLVIDTTEINSANFVAEPNHQSPGDVNDSAGLVRRRRPEVMVQDFTGSPQPQTEKAEMLVEFIHAPNKLKKKVGEGATGFDPGVFVKANEVIKNLAASYIDGIATKEMRELGYMFQSLEHFPERSNEQIAKIFHHTHTVKSGGGSYGYPLISRIAESLGKLTEGMGAPEKIDIMLIKFHVDALNIVVRKKIKGMGGEIGQLLSEGLEVVVARRKAHDPSLVVENISKFLEKLDSA